MFPSRAVHFKCFALRIESTRDGAPTSRPLCGIVAPGAVTGTVVAVQGQNVAIPAGYAAGAEWQVMLPTAKVVQQSGLVGMAQLLGGADRIHINQRMMMFEALSCGMWEQKNKYDIRIGDKEGPTVMVATEESKPWTRLCCAPRHSAFVYFAPAYDQNNVILTMERPGCRLKILWRSFWASCGDKQRFEWRSSEQTRDSTSTELPA